MLNTLHSFVTIGTNTRSRLRHIFDGFMLPFQVNDSILPHLTYQWGQNCPHFWHPRA